MGIHRPIECILLRPNWEVALVRFLSDLHDAGDEEFFYPHAGDEKTIHELALAPGRDLYYLFVENRQVLTYGLLRGWNEGYAVPSLGVAVHPSARSSGLGRLMMDYLEAMARRSDSPAIRLRVHKKNLRALKMYQRRGYVMTLDERDSRLMIGTKTIGHNAT